MPTREELDRLAALPVTPRYAPPSTGDLAWLQAQPVTLQGRMAAGLDTPAALSDRYSQAMQANEQALLLSQRMQQAGAGQGYQAGPSQYGSLERVNAEQEAFRRATLSPSQQRQLIDLDAKMQRVATERTLREKERLQVQQALMRRAEAIRNSPRIVSDEEREQWGSNRGEFEASEDERLQSAAARIGAEADAASKTVKAKGAARRAEADEARTGRDDFGRQYRQIEKDLTVEVLGGTPRLPSREQVLERMREMDSAYEEYTGAADTQQRTFRGPDATAQRDDAQARYSDPRAAALAKYLTGIEGTLREMGQPLPPALQTMKAQMTDTLAPGQPHSVWNTGEQPATGSPQRGTRQAPRQAQGPSPTGDVVGREFTEAEAAAYEPMRNRADPAYGDYAARLRQRIGHLEEQERQMRARLADAKRREQELDPGGRRHSRSYQETPEFQRYETAVALRKEMEEKLADAKKQREELLVEIENPTDDGLYAFARERAAPDKQKQLESLHERMRKARSPEEARAIMAEALKGS